MKCAWDTQIAMHIANKMICILISFLKSVFECYQVPIIRIMGSWCYTVSAWVLLWKFLKKWLLPFLSIVACNSVSHCVALSHSQLEILGQPGEKRLFWQHFPLTGIQSFIMSMNLCSQLAKTCQCPQVEHFKPLQSVLSINELTGFGKVSVSIIMHTHNDMGLVGCTSLLTGLQFLNHL